MSSRRHNSISYLISTRRQTRYVKRYAHGVSCRARKSTYLVQMSKHWRNEVLTKYLYSNLPIWGTSQLIGALLQFRDVQHWEIYLKEHLASSCLFKGSDNFTRLDTYSAEVENSNMPKTVRVYCSHYDSNKLDVVMTVSFLVLSHPWCSGVL